MQETPESITEWANSVFGVPKSTLSVLARANLEVAELMYKVAHHECDTIIPGVAVECADVYIVLCRVFTMNQITSIMPWADVILRTSVPTETHLELTNRILRQLGACFSTMEMSNPETAKRSLQYHLPNLVTDLYMLCKKQFHELPNMVDQKMQINRARQWKIDGNGHGQHVETTDAP